MWLDSVFGSMITYCAWWNILLNHQDPLFNNALKGQFDACIFGVGAACIVDWEQEMHLEFAGHSPYWVDTSISKFRLLDS